MSRRLRIAWTVAFVVMVIGAGVAGFVVRGVVDADDASDGHMVYGVVSSVQADTQTVCITDDSTTCALLMTGELPSTGEHVRGWLVRVPAGDDSNVVTTNYWAFVTTLAT